MPELVQTKVLGTTQMAHLCEEHVRCFSGCAEALYQAHPLSLARGPENTQIYFFKSVLGTRQEGKLVPKACLETQMKYPCYLCWFFLHLPPPVPPNNLFGSCLVFEVLLSRFTLSFPWSFRKCQGKSQERPGFFSPWEPLKTLKNKQRTLKKTKESCSKKTPRQRRTGHFIGCD